MCQKMVLTWSKRFCSLDSGSRAPNLSARLGGWESADRLPMALNTEGSDKDTRTVRYQSNLERLGYRIDRHCVLCAVVLP